MSRIWSSWPTEHYDIILADPPWTFKTWSKKGAGRTASSHYDVMSVRDICALPVSKIASPDSVLFLWGVPSNLLAALEVIHAWGFTYKTWGFLWVKLNQDGSPFMGMGYYTRSNAEPCLLATRGKPLPRLSKAVRQVILSPRREHSRKPDEAYSRIEQLYGDRPRIELFARYAWPGWDSWGNELCCQ